MKAAPNGTGHDVGSPIDLVTMQLELKRCVETLANLNALVDAGARGDEFTALKSTYLPRAIDWTWERTAKVVERYCEALGKPAAELSDEEKQAELDRRRGKVAAIFADGVAHVLKVMDKRQSTEAPKAADVRSWAESYAQGKVRSLAQP